MLVVSFSYQLRRSTRALFEAVRRGFVDVALVLLENGIPADVADPDSELGDAALHEAVRTGNIGMVKVYISLLRRKRKYVYICLCQFRAFGEYFFCLSLSFYVFYSATPQTSCHCQQNQQ